MKIGLISLDIVWEDKDRNKKKCLLLIKKMKLKGCRFVIFPEMTLTGFTMNIRDNSESLKYSETINWFKNISRQYKIFIAFGLIVRKGKKATNNLLICNPNGKIVCNYEKIHPFSYANENKYYYGGNKICRCSIDDFKFGLSICYDLRFPEVFRALSKNCESIINIANWPESRIYHWEILLKARAIENQVFMIGVNRQGKDGNGILYKKSSAIIGPTGDKYQAMEKGKDYDIYDISVNTVYDFRKNFPVMKDRKKSLYIKII